MRGPTVIPRAEIDRDTAQRQAFAPPRDQIREAASMAGELVGTEPLARGVMALRGDLTGRPEPGRAAGEFGMAAVNLGLGALGLADDIATVRAARPLPPSMRASAESAPRPTPPPRQIGRASDGSVLPVREPQPIRQSLVGGSDDLMGAARLNNRPDPHGEGVGADMRRPMFPGRRGGGDLPMDEASRMARAREMGFDVDTPLYVSSLEDLQRFEPYGKFYGNSGVAGIHLTDNPEMAARYLDRYGDVNYRGIPFDKTVMPVFIRPGRIRDAIGRVGNGSMGFPRPDNYSWPRSLEGVDTIRRRDGISSTGDVQHGSEEDFALLRELDADEQTYRGAPIIGTEYILRDPSRIRSRFARFDPRNADSSDLMAALPLAALGGAGAAMGTQKRPRSSDRGRLS